jgi:hypothetical protein
VKDADMCRLLTTYWIKPGNRSGPLGLGVTAYSLNDAIDIIRKSGYGRWLPDDLAEINFIEDVRFDDLEQEYVRQHMGPIVVRGMWYPFTHLGPPVW